jgi:hypothetical protein
VTAADSPHWTVVQRLKGEVIARTRFATHADAEVHAQGLLRDLGGVVIYIESPVAPLPPPAKP